MTVNILHLSKKDYSHLPSYVQGFCWYIPFIDAACWSCPVGSELRPAYPHCGGPAASLDGLLSPQWHLSPCCLQCTTLTLTLNLTQDLRGGVLAFWQGCCGECCLGLKISFTTLLSQLYGSWLHDIFLIATRVSGLQSEPLVAFLTVLEWHGHT